MPKVVKNKRAKILQGFKFQTDKQLLANQLGIIAVDKVQKTPIMTDEAIAVDNNIRKNEHDKIQKEAE